MAMGGHNKGNNGNRRRPYALMLLLAFGAALFGVMVVHKFREKRIFNLLIKEKDRDILSLQLLLQKERGQTQEMKKRTEVMRVKIYSLGSQKMELDNTIREMQATISSLRDEQRLLESALEENQKEIMMLREKDSGRNDSQEPYLNGMLKQKEAEIEELKRQLEAHVRLGKGQTTDPSSYQQVNSTSASSDIVDIEKNNILSNSTETSNGGDQSGNMVIEDGTKSKTKGGVEKVVIVTSSRDSTLVLQKQGSNSDENPMDGGTADQSNVAKVQGANNNESKSDESQDTQRSIVEDDGKSPNGENTMFDAGNNSRDKEANGDVQTMGTEQVRRKNLEEDEKVERRISQAGLAKLEFEPSDISSSNGSSSSSTAKSTVASAGKKSRKKRRVIARNQRVEHKAASETTDAVFAKYRKSSGDVMETENREVAEVRLHEVTARGRYHDQSHLIKANKSDRTEDGMQENFKPVEQNDPAQEDSDQSEFESKSALDKEMMNVESSAKSKEDASEDDEPSDFSEGKLLQLATPKRTEELKGSATAVDVTQQDQKEKGDNRLEKSSDSDKVELPINRRFSGNFTDKVEKQEVNIGITQGVEQEANAIEDEGNEPEETYG